MKIIILSLPEICTVTIYVLYVAHGPCRLQGYNEYQIFLTYVTMVVVGYQQVIAFCFLVFLVGTNYSIEQVIHFCCKKKKINK